jgi:PIN domain nuclease of toxin-antitoxin system
VRTAVLDASAILAVLQGEAGKTKIERVLSRAAISAVNHSEVLAHLIERSMPRREVERAIASLDLEVVPFDAAQSAAAAALRPATRHLGLSLPDRACLALAKLRRQPAYTTDRAWAQLHVGVRIELAR